MGGQILASHTRPDTLLIVSNLVFSAIATNFPLGKDLEKEWDANAGIALVVKTDANMLQLVDNETLEPKKVFTYGAVDKEYSDRFAAAHHQYDVETGEWRMVPFYS